MGWTFWNAGCCATGGTGWGCAGGTGAAGGACWANAASKGFTLLGVVPPDAPPKMEAMSRPSPVISVKGNPLLLGSLIIFSPLVFGDKKGP